MLTQHPIRAAKSLRLVLAAVVLLASYATFALSAAGTSAKSIPPDLKKIHALLVIDTESTLKDSVLHDRHNMETMLKGYIPEKYRDITVLEGKNVTRQAILDYYQRLRTGPDETVLFFYAGHGKLDEKNRHCLQLQEGNVDLIRREDVLHAMKAKNPGLVVLLTDCCSVKTRLTASNVADDRLAISPYPHPVVRCLLFQHRGVVDITAAQDGTGSWGDDKRGGIFTQSLCGLLKDQIKGFDRNRDRFVSWKEFFPQLERKTEDTFERWCESMRASEKVDIKKQQRTQRPRAFSPLPDNDNDLLAKGDSKPAIKSNKNAFAVVTLINKTGKALNYRYRWTRDDTWKEVKLEKGGKKLHDQLVKADLMESQLPHLEVEIPSEKAHSELQPRKWVGLGKPAFKDAREIELTSDK